MRDRYPAGARRLPFTVAAIVGAIMMIVGIALPAQRHVGYGIDSSTLEYFYEEGSASFAQDLFGTDSWYRIEGGAAVCGFAIAALAVAAIYAVWYHRALAFAVVVFGLAASITVLGTGTIAVYAPDSSFTASPAEGAYVSIAGAGLLFLAPFAEFLKDPANRRPPSGRASRNAGR